MKHQFRYKMGRVARLHALEEIHVLFHVKQSKSEMWIAVKFLDQPGEANCFTWNNSVAGLAMFQVEGTP